MASVIVIDEDEPVRALLAEWLAAAGHDVVLAQRGASGGGTAVALVVIDLPRPRERGAALLAPLRVAWPGVRIVGLSTQLRASLPPGSPLLRELGLARLLAKPCTRAELLAAVDAALHPR
ncbi:response regulator transcription factor [Pelomonas sp. KK5]|uniref:response regulator transcription factor n=1 Tax=Pelomonas sp. KK5 TaxID=1855730 RepID=UPI00097C1523|nr:response regulator transcription factor [Pelomonas sp. KK5]